MADLSSNSPPEDGEIVFDTPNKESSVDGVDEQTPKTGLRTIGAIPMIQRVKVRARFHGCKQNLVRIEGHSQVFTWLLLRFGSLL